MRIKTLLSRITGNDYLYTIGVKVFAMFIGLVATGFSARYLGPDLKGDLSVISSYLLTVSVVANFGLYQPYPYYKNLNEPDVLDKFMRIFVLQFLVYTVLGGVLAAYLGDMKWVAVCLITPIQVLSNQLSFVIIVEDVKYKNTVFLLARTLNTLIVVVAFFTLEPLLLLALAMIVVGDVLTVVMVLRRLKRFPNPFKADFAFMKRIAGFGLVTMLTTLLLTFNSKLDVMMMDWMGVTAKQIGYYGFGASLAEYGWIISDAFREVLFSRTSRKDVVRSLTFSLRINLYITLLMVFSIAVLGKLVIRIVSGPAFLPAYGVTVILLAGIISMSYFKLIGTLLLAQGKKMIYLFMLAASVVVNAIANYFAIPIWGIEGAAMASVLSYTLAGVLFLAYFMRTYQVPLRDIFVMQSGEVRGLWLKLRGKR